MRLTKLVIADLQLRMEHNKHCGNREGEEEEVFMQGGRVGVEIWECVCVSKYELRGRDVFDPSTPQYEDGDGEEDHWEGTTHDYLEELLGTAECGGYEEQCEEEEEDPDLKDEAILQIDMEVMFLCTCIVCVHALV